MGGGSDLMKAVAARAYEKAKEQGVTVIRARISLELDNVQLTFGGPKDVIAYLGIEDECKQFADEFNKIAQKYVKTVSAKYQERINENPEETARNMARWMFLESRR